jgi:hypothetical protein
MRISNITNDNIVIKARNEADYEMAYKIAERMAANSQGEIVMCSADDCEFWVQLTCRWSYFQANEIKTEFQIAKKEIQKECK